MNSPANNSGAWDTNYEWKITTLLLIGFGLVSLDRNILGPLFPFIQADLGLADGDAGRLAGVLGLAWGVSAIFSGRLADKIGHRKILIPTIIIVSLMSGFSGMAQGLTVLIFIRAMMGTMEGGFCPTSFVAVASAAKPERRGLNQGLQQSGFALFGLALGPIFAIQLLKVVPSWREVFWITAIPGFVVAILLYFILKEPKDTQGGAIIGATTTNPGSWFDVLKSKNIIIAMLALFCAMTCLFVLGAMVPTYLINFLQVSPEQMGFIMSAIGFGGFLGQFMMPGVSDKFGRKPVCIAGFVGATIALYWFSQTGANPMVLFVSLFITCFFTLGNMALITGPISTESAPLGLVAASIGLVVGAGEIFGGGVAPIIAGSFADNFGLPSVLQLALGGSAMGIIVAPFLRETAPRKVAAAAASQQA